MSIIVAMLIGGFGVFALLMGDQIQLVLTQRRFDAWMTRLEDEIALYGAPVR